MELDVQNDFMAFNEFYELRSILSPTVGKSFISKSPRTQANSFDNISWNSYMTFLGGVTVGGAVVMGSNVQNKCLSGVTKLIINSYSIYHYLNNYMTTQSQASIAYAMTYVVQMFNAGFNI